MFSNLRANVSPSRENDVFHAKMSLLYVLSHKRAKFKSPMHISNCHWGIFKVLSDFGVYL